MNWLGARCGAILCLLLFWASAPAVAADTRFPDRTWESANPADMGWSTSKLRKARDQFREMDSTALLIVQGGQIIAEWGDTRRVVKIIRSEKAS
jgi:hypothetical protein